MYLTGKQVNTLAELSDGADVRIETAVVISPFERQGTIRFTRMEDGLSGTINTDGVFLAKETPKHPGHSVKV